jgi:acyl-CoA hydrolase
VEVTHNHASLATDTFVAVNTALEIDLSGQVNVETIKGSIVAGLGGHADFAFAASSSRKGLSIVALPSRRGNNSTLVEQLDKHVTTQRSDIDMFVNEHGYVDVRGLSDEEKRRALFRLWDL